MADAPGMHRRPRVVVLGSYSGRNAGDAAILFQIADDFAREAPESLLLVPTTHPQFIRKHFDPDHVIPISTLPWNLTLRSLGVPLVKAILKSQLVLITDGILFDYGLYNPLFSHMPSITLAAAFCRLRKVPMVGYNIGVGPMTRNVGMALMRYVAASSDVLYAREEDSVSLLRNIGVPVEKIRLSADCVFALKGAGEERGRQILRDVTGGEQGPWVGLNMCGYLGNMLGVSLRKEEVISKLARAADRLLAVVPAKLVIVVTQLMDTSFAQAVVSQMDRKSEVKFITNETLTPREIVSMVSHFDLLFGMRFHSLVLSSAAGTPAIGIAYAPKVKSYMTLMGLERWRMDVTSFDDAHFAELAAQAWSERVALREQVRSKVRGLADLARKTATEVAERYLLPCGGEAGARPQAAPGGSR